MKTAKEILNHHYSFVDDLSEVEYNDLLSAISFAQDNAYNQALLDASENVECETDTRGNYTINVDKQSILNLRK